MRAVPLWLKLAPEVAQVMRMYQSIVATRNDLGQLASMHNKFVRLALYRLRLSMKEYAGELPAEVERVFAEVTRPDASVKPRIVVPTRPSLFGKGEKVRVMIIVPGAAKVASVVVDVRPRGGAWAPLKARLMGRKTYEAVLGPFDPAAAEVVEYRVTARADGQNLVSATYSATVV